ncbi:MAG: hypothetical protein M5U14_08400 [Acidimicrobiia bacterium]|nr:hypothetical protein [Acidimicrobiia bacterium]
MDRTSEDRTSEATARVDTRSDAGGGLAAPPVLLEPCPDYEVDPEEPGGCCLACGWLAQDHGVVAGGAVTVLRAGRAGLVERRAS